MVLVCSVFFINYILIVHINCLFVSLFSNQPFSSRLSACLSVFLHNFTSFPFIAFALCTVSINNNLYLVSEITFRLQFTKTER